MNKRLTAIVERDGDGYVALCPEVDIASEGETAAEARDNLAEALSLFFEAAGAGEVHRRLREGKHVMHLELTAPVTTTQSKKEQTLEDHLDELERVGALVRSAPPNQQFRTVERRPGALARFLAERGE